MTPKVIKKVKGKTIWQELMLFYSKNRFLSFVG